MKKFISIFMILMSPVVKAQEPEALQKEDSLEFDVKRLAINSNAGDFSPFLRNNELYFVSGRARQESVKYLDRNQRSDITDIYVARKTASGFGRPRPLDAVNSAYYEGPFCLNSNGTVMYFSGTERRTGLLKIFRTAKNKGKWGKPEQMNFCKTAHSYCHPALVNDSLLVFSSNADSAMGMDLFMSRITGAICDTPVNLGPRFNSSANEIFPAYANGKLYFSSNREGGLGGLDIYATSWQDNASRPVPLKFPINSPVDDFGISFASADEGYFSSNRVAGSDDDIFSFTRVIPDFSVAKPPPVMQCYYFFEENASKLKDTADFLFAWKYGDGSGDTGIKTRHCYNKPGNYQVSLEVKNKKTDSVAASITYSLSVADPQLLSIHCRDTVILGDTVPLTGNVSLKGFQVNNTYWSFGDGRYNRSAEVEHQFRRPGRYNVEMLVEAVHPETSRVELFKVSREITVVEKEED
jgi:hypothetical protein